MLLDAQGPGESARAAQCAVLRRYGGAIYHYLVATTGDPHAASDLAQEFALKFLRGDLRELDPGRGQFRKFLRTVLYRMAMDHHRARRRVPVSLPADADVGVDVMQLHSSDQEFDRRWRDELLERAWEELKKAQEPTGSPYYVALRWRSENPDQPTSAGAMELEQRLGRAFSADSFRQTLHRARTKFAELLTAEVAFSIGTDSPEVVEPELADLGLLTYCRVQ